MFLDHVSVAFGHLPLLDDVSFSIEPGERVAVLGRNGEGKSTLLKVIAGDLAPDAGVVRRPPGTRVARLAQDADALDAYGDATVFEAVAAGLGTLRDLVNAYHHAAARVTHDHSEAAIAELGRLQHELEERDGWRIEQRIETVLTKLGLDGAAGLKTGRSGDDSAGLKTGRSGDDSAGLKTDRSGDDSAGLKTGRSDLKTGRSDLKTGRSDVKTGGAEARVATLSGGWRRRVLLAQALVSEPTLLLLDEPTNHLDLDAIVWLETMLADYPGAVVVVTHDRVFLQRVATRIVELDRGRLTSWPGDYRTFLEKKDAWLANEAQANEVFDKKLAQEEAWLRRGVKARRTRDEGRVRRLLAMREERAARRTRAGAVRVDLGGTDRSGHVVFEAEGISKSFGSRVVVRDFSTRVMRADRVGLVGPNGAGKTTLLRMLAGELAPDSGTVERGTNVQIAYFDQLRAALDPERTVVDTVGDGNDWVTAGGRKRHIHGYLEDFLFTPERAQAKVKMLSGGERNRLLLARLLTQPANVLILDEPTNDLDLETLSVLEAELAEFPGTILVVSHDRAFLENVVTSTWRFEGDGRIEEYVGTDFEKWSASASASAGPAPVATTPERAKAAPPRAEPSRRKLAYHEQREYDALPGRIDALEAEARTLQARIAAPEFYKEGKSEIEAALARLETLKSELDGLYARWAELDARA